MDYLSFSFSFPEDWQKEILIAHLSDIGFGGFQEETYNTIAFIPVSDFYQADFDQCIQLMQQYFPVHYVRHVIPYQNWNALWEKNFQPIVIGEEIVVRASFHLKIPVVKHDIVIDPKMAFGTGHHETTAMMLRMMLQENFTNKKVLDFGTGTGILSILASRLGASEILAIDNDNHATDNAKENIFLNNILNARVIHGGIDSLKENKFDIILANINREVIIHSIENLAKSLNNQGALFLSGFYNNDMGAILHKTSFYQLQLTDKFTENNWIAMQLKSK
ncbi:MAG: 50S ribosomal protein L11 methyltransferase [Chitinophagales bacterium]|nr:50S ribosomal protein L11 methyltransferase [Chitinophagales bacterium]